MLIAAMDFLNYFEQLEKVCNFHKQVSEQRAMLAKPTLNDFSKLKDIKFIVYNKLNGTHNDKRRAFLCTVLILYAPTALLGVERMPKNLRMHIGELFDKRSYSIYSILMRTLMTEYRVYNSFRKQVNECCDEVLSTLGVKNNNI